MTVTSASVNQDNLRQLSTLQLPSLPAGTPFLLKSLSNQNIDYSELSSIIEKFPSITGKLISLANSVWSAPITEITSVEMVCSRLGFSVVRSASIAIAVAAPFNPTKCPAFDSEHFWCSAFMTAEAASSLVPAMTNPTDLEPATARVAGLLHNLSLLWLVDKLPNEVDQAISLSENGEVDSLQQSLTQILGFGHLQAGQQLGCSWELPDSIVLPMTHYSDIDYQNTKHEIVNTVGLAARLASFVLHQDLPPEPDIRLSKLGISMEDFESIYTKLSGQLDKTRAIAKELT